MRGLDQWFVFYFVSESGTAVAYKLNEELCGQKNVQYE